MRELRNIAIFSEVASCQSFSKAARNLQLTPSAVSMSVQKLESVLGTRLLNRTTRELHLTPDGHAFLAFAEEGLRKVNEAFDLFEDRKSAPSGHLRVSMVSGLGRSFVLPALPRFLAENPGITIDLSFSDQLPNLVRDKFDVGLCHGEPPDGSYVSRFICAPPMALVAAPAYLALAGAPVRPEDLAHHAIVDIRLRDGLDPSWTLQERIAIAGAQSEPVVFTPTGGQTTLDHHDAAIDAALAGLGVALVLRQAAAAHLKSGALAPVLPTYDVKLTHAGKVFLLFPSKRYLPARARAFIDFLVELGRRHSWSGRVDVAAAQSPAVAAAH
jgi:DNA-binding transcriptional LysR family regulator